MTNRIEFQGWPKMPRLASPYIITEKIDGTNSAVLILPLADVDHFRVGVDGPIEFFDGVREKVLALVEDNGDRFVVFAQSRKRFITPESDNFGFAAWVKANAEALVAALGPGRHFGEWWGSGIQRGYGLPKGVKQFSLFNATRYKDVDIPGIGLGAVPVLSQGFIDIPLADQAQRVKGAIAMLIKYGSYAAPGFMKPEGVILLHERSNQMFKTYVDDTEKHA